MWGSSSISCSYFPGPPRFPPQLEYDQFSTLISLVNMVLTVSYDYLKNCRMLNSAPGNRANMLDSIHDPQPLPMPGPNTKSRIRRRKGTISSSCILPHPLTPSHSPALGIIPPRSLRLYSLLPRGIRLIMPAGHEITLRAGSKRSRKGP